MSPSRSPQLLPRRGAARRTAARHAALAAAAAALVAAALCAPASARAQAVCTTNADCLTATPYCTAAGCVAGAVAITAPAAGSTATSRMPTISGTATPGQTVTVSVGGVMLTAMADAATGAWSVTPTTPLPVGSVTATATIPPEAGMSPSAMVTFTVPCSMNSECTTATAPICDATMHVCRACASNTDCSAAAPVCASTGACVLCTTGATGMAMACATNMAGHACIDPGGGGAVFCGCNADADCGAVDSGRVCDATMHRCVAGCSAAPTRNHCSSLQVCTNTDTTGATVGVCTTSCMTNLQCMTSMPFRPYCLMPSPPDAGADGGTDGAIDSGALDAAADGAMDVATDVAPDVARDGAADGSTTPMNVCVECLTDTNCAARTDGRTLCIGPGNTCAQCSSTNQTLCSADATGSFCISTGRCGCRTDADCSAARMCDLVVHRCAPREGFDAGSDAMADGEVQDVPVSLDVAEDAVEDAGQDAGQDAAQPDVVETDTRMFADAARDTSPPRDGAGEGGLTLTGGGTCNCRVVAGGAPAGGRTGRTAVALLAALAGVAFVRRRNRRG